MNKNAKTRTWWFGWMGWFTEKLEAWLEAKAAEGWQFVKADRALMRFHFQRSKPKTVRLCVDYQSNPPSEYKTIFQDAGWQLVCESIGWYIWRKEYTGARPEIFSDIDSLVDRNNRLMLVLLGSLIAQVPLYFTGIFDRIPETAFWQIVKLLYMLLVLVDFLFVLGTYMANTNLKARKC